MTLQYHMRLLQFRVKCPGWAVARSQPTDRNWNAFRQQRPHPGRSRGHRRRPALCAGLDASDAGTAGAWKAQLAQLASAISAQEHKSSNKKARDEPEKVLLVGIGLQHSASNVGGEAHSSDESLEELSSLAQSAGLQVVGFLQQRLEKPDAQTFLGSGKLGELLQCVEKTQARTIIFDGELTPRQLKNLTKALVGIEARVCDRTALILDIFKQRAQSREGKLQVELAAAQMQLPLQTRLWSHLERQAGDGRMRGMGEKQVEIDRRLLRSRLAVLRSRLQEVQANREQYRRHREEAGVPVVALVGYTNAGKSCLLNRLTAAGVPSRDALFATLDTTMRRMSLPSGLEVVVSDTVGFIQRLPPQLVAAFRSTLEHIGSASLIAHVVDVSHPLAAAQSAAVMQVLKDINAADIPRITVWNKIDLVGDPDMVHLVAAGREAVVCCSAATGEGIDGLLHAFERHLCKGMVLRRALIPFSQGSVLAEVRRMGLVRSELHCASGSGTIISAHVPRDSQLAAHLEKFAVSAISGQNATTRIC